MTLVMKKRLIIGATNAAKSLSDLMKDGLLDTPRR